MHTNGFCHLWLGKIYDSAPQSCKQSTKQQTLAPYGILQRRNLKGKSPGRVGGESRPQKSARRHFLFKPSGSDVAFEERRRGSIINPHFLLQTADATLSAFSAKPEAGKAVRTRPRSGLSGPKGLGALEQRAREYAMHTFPAPPNQAQQPKRQAQARPEELQEPRESSGERSAQTRASRHPRLAPRWLWAVGPSRQNSALISIRASRHIDCGYPGLRVSSEIQKAGFGAGIGEVIKNNNLY